MTKSIWWILGGIGVAGLGVSGYYLFVKPKKPSVPVFPNFSNSPVRTNISTRATPVAEPNWKAPFDMNYLKDVKNWLRGKRMIELSPEMAAHFAAQLKNAKGVFDDDEEAVEKVFRSLRDKTQVASISKAFYFKYGRQDLWKYLRSFLSDSELEKYVHAPVRRLENYRIA